MCYQVPNSIDTGGMSIELQRQPLEIGRSASEAYGRVAGAGEGGSGDHQLSRMRAQGKLSAATSNDARDDFA